MTVLLRRPASWAARPVLLVVLLGLLSMHGLPSTEHAVAATTDVAVHCSHWPASPDRGRHGAGSGQEQPAPLADLPADDIIDNGRPRVRHWKDQP